MLDTEPTDNSPESTSAEAASAPAKKAARKAPAKRAPRKAKAIAPDPVAATEPAAPVLAEPELEAATAEAGSQASAPAPAKKAPRKRAAKKVAAPAAEPVSADPDIPTAGTPVADRPTETAPIDTVPAETAPAEPAAIGSAPTEPAAPAKKAARKRASKKAAPVTVEATGATDTDPAEPAAAPALAAPAVLFQPPSETKPTSRRRTAKPKLAEPVVEPDAELEFPVEPIAEAEDVDADDATGSDEATDESEGPRRRRRRGRRGRGSRSGSAGGEDGNDSGDATDSTDPDPDPDADADESEDAEHADEVAEAALSASARRRRRRRRSTSGEDDAGTDDPPNTVTHVRESRSNRSSAADDDGVRGVKGSTRLEAKRQRRRDNRDSGRRRAPILTEAEFLARREAVERVMAVRQTGDRTQIAVLEDDILVEHYVTRASAASAVGNVYLGRVQNVLPSMEAAFVDIGRGRNGVLYAGEVNWDSAGLEGKARSIENAMSSGDSVLVQVTKDPIGHKGARLTSQISLPGRFVVYVPGGGMTGISRKLPDTERSRLKAILKKVVPDEAGVIVRTAAEGASEQDLISDVERLKAEWEVISAKAAKKSDGPQLVHGEPDLAIRVVRDIFNDDFSKLIVAGSDMHATLSDYVRDIAPELAARISLHTAETELFRDLRVDEQLAKALDRKVWLPSGGSLVIDRTEAMTVVDVNTGKYTGSGGNLEQTVTRNNIEAAEEIVRQLRLRDLGGIVVIDFIDMVLESNRDLVLRRLTECLGRDRTKHQVAEVTSLGLVQMTRKRVGEGLLEAFSEPCEHCHGRGIIVHMEPVDKKSGGNQQQHNHAEDERPARGKRSRGTKSTAAKAPAEPVDVEAENVKRRAAASAIAAIAAATAHHDELPAQDGDVIAAVQQQSVVDTRSGADSTQSVADTQSVAELQSVSENGTGSATGPASAGSEPDTSGHGVGEATPPAEKAPSRPRRRRAASRPAGPPVHTA